MTLALTRMLATDYSQSGEQEAILQAVEGLPIGRFLDIGAGDGETFSNTRALALRGWGGVVVEPAAWAFDKLVDLYADSLVEPVCAVVMPYLNGLVRLAYSKDDHLSSVDPEHVAKWARLVPFREVTAAAVSLERIVQHADAGISVVSIDAEGVTLDLVRAYMGLPQWDEVKVIVYEVDGPKAKLSLRWQGWQLVARTTNNAIYARG